MRGRKPALLQALESLKSVASTGNAVSIDLAFDTCRTVSGDVHYAYVLYREIGEIALSLSQWQLAEEFAVKSLLVVPSYGGALKVMGLALRGQGRMSEAAICHRYGLPKTIRKQYFSSETYRPIQSEDSLYVDRLPAYPSEIRSITPPVSVDDNHKQELAQQQLHSLAANTFHLSDARLWFDGFNTVLWDSSGQTIKDVSRGLADVVHCALSSRTPIALPGRTCLLGNRNSDNYYHWMNDILPRIHVLTSSGIDVKSISQFVVNPLKHVFQYETLEKLGIDKDQLYSSDRQNYFQCDELFVPVFGSNTLGMRQGKWIPEFLNDCLLDNHDPLPQRRLYISRKNATGRAVQNEDDLKEFLTDKGFQTVYLENTSVAEQSRLFRSATVVISSHGAGLSNIVFCREGTRIIELYKDHLAPCFWVTSELRSLQHAVLYCGDQHDNDLAHGSETYHISADNRRRSDFSVDMDRLRQLFMKLGIE